MARSTMSLRLTSLFLAIATAGAAATRMVLHESRASAPTGFVSQGMAPDDQTLTLRVGLAANNIAGLQDKLMSISTPGSPEFRQWLSQDEVKSFVRPSQETISAFNAFLSANSLSSTVISPNGDWVSITLPVSKANSLFATKFQTFTHPDIETSVTRTLTFSLPEELVGHVDVVHPTTEFTGANVRLGPKPYAALVGNAKREAGDVPASCNTIVPTGIITPRCLQDLYGIPATPATERRNTLLVTGYVGQFAQKADLTSFLKALRPDINSATSFRLDTLDGGVNTQNASDAGVEANLDTQYTIGVATDVPATFLTVGDKNFATALLDTTIFLDRVENPPSVMTTSYGDTESHFGASLATRICNGYMALGARGISVLFASGDGGVRGNHDTKSVCANNTFMPVFPAACPFLTSVGSTQGIPEIAINFTGGGFSNVFPRPSYQNDAVSSFLSTIPSTFKGIFNKAGRGYPDVAVQGWNFEIFVAGQAGLVGGTSASSPTFAAAIALINDELVRAEKPVLGFLNPFIYGKASTAFTDITVGHNSGFVCPNTSVAFDAVRGWDALTGFGTPIFSKLRAAAGLEQQHGAE